MTKFGKIIVFLAIFCALSVGIFITDAKRQAKAETCYDPFLYIDKMDEIYSHSVCKGNFQVYYFPVIADGRKYTITLHNIEGKQKLYASRYKNKVDNLDSILNWQCNTPSCDSSAQIGAKTRIVSFRAPSGEPSYYSWFAVYGTSASKYQVGVSNNGVLKLIISANSNGKIESNSTTPDVATNTWSSVKWKATPIENFQNFNNTSWTQISFNESGWEEISLPDKDWGCDNCYRRYRGTFNLETVPNNLKMQFSSDDGLWLYVNGKFIGHWGANDVNEQKCVNGGICFYNEGVEDILLDNLVKGKNVISAIVVDGGSDEYFNLNLKQ